jgi:hypothetical protein
VLITPAPLVAQVEVKLQLCAQAPHLSPRDYAVCIQILRWVLAPRVAVFGKLLPTVSSLIEQKRVKIDLSSAFIPQHEARRKPWFACGVVLESLLRQHMPYSVEIIAIDGEVEIGMVSSLRAYERIDSPSPVDIDADACSLETNQHLDYIARGHCRSRVGSCYELGPRALAAARAVRAKKPHTIGSSKNAL